jgi:RNA polymerase sigma-70 factor (ECF subfamily)
MTVASNYSKSNESAKEIVNDAFLKVFTNLKKFNQKQVFKAWFRQIIVHTGIDHYRQNKMELDNRSQKLKSEFYYNKSELDLDSEYLVDMVRTLSPAYQMVFILYAVEGYKHAEIADKLSISIGTSKSNLARARKILMEKLLTYRSEQLKYGS